MKTYLDFVKQTEKLFAEAVSIPTGASASFGGSTAAEYFAANPAVSDSDRLSLKDKIEKFGLSASILVFAPHPDDESMVSLAYRFQRECGFEIFDVATTFGSNVARRDGRRAELKSACDFLGWQMIPAGFERITAHSRETEPAHWNECVAQTAKMILERRPAAILAPHCGDWNGTHIGTGLLVRDALEKISDKWNGVYILTEYWGAMADPNLLSEVSPEILAAQIGAISCHTKEVERNAYHLRLPAFMCDNVRRGGELVGGQGGEAPSFPFGQLYRVLQNREGKWESAFKSKIITKSESVSSIFKDTIWK